MRKLPRFFVPPDCIGRETVSLTSGIVGHAIRVLRLSEGDPIVLFNGKGLEIEARLAKDGKRNYVAEILKRQKHSYDSRVQFFLFQAFVKKERWEWLLEKSAELGVFSIIPLITQFTEVERGDHFFRKKTRWESILQAACEQSGRTFLPELSAPVFLEEAFQKAPGIRLLFQYSSHAVPLKDVLPRLADVKLLSLFIGPEGGFAPEEIALAKSHHISPVSLGKLTLRSETAGVAALACLSAWFDR